MSSESASTDRRRTRDLKATEPPLMHSRTEIIPLESLSVFRLMPRGSRATRHRSDARRATSAAPSAHPGSTSRASQDAGRSVGRFPNGRPTGAPCRRLAVQSGRDFGVTGQAAAVVSIKAIGERDVAGMSLRRTALTGHPPTPRKRRTPRSDDRGVTTVRSGSGRGPSALYSMIFDTTPAPTVRPPSRMAKRSFSSIAIGAISSTPKETLSPGITISVPSAS